MATSKVMKPITTRCIRLNMGTISSLPITMSAPGVNADMRCIDCYLGTPVAQADDWVITVGTDTVTISGNVTSGQTTTCRLTLIEYESMTAEAQT